MGASASSSNRFPEIEKYELIEEIGHGGMATVYRAMDRRLEREVAVKVIHKHLRANLEVRRRFVSEAKAVAKLRHPGIVEVFDVADEDDIERYLVVELIRGMSLRQLFEQRKQLPAEVAAALIATLCDAVEHAHSHGVIHRDIKPENVLIELPDTGGPDSDDDEDESATGVRRKAARSSNRAGGGGVVIKLTDFGIAKVLDAQGVTSTGQILGSPAHMAPEQIEGGEIGAHTDVFALGVLMYECMVGHLPFEGRNPAQVLRRVLEGDFDPADDERAEVGGRWASIIALALANDVEARIASAADLGKLIDDELHSLGVEDPRGDMVAYFRDDAAYMSRITALLVPRLLERGEGERRAGNVHLAASDFNRALALRPDDLAILKRITSLSAQTVWKERGLRFGTILFSSLALGGVAYGVTRLVKSDETAAAPTASLSVAPVASSAPPPPPQPPSARPHAVPKAPPPPDPTAVPSSSASTSSAPVGPAPTPAPGPSGGPVEPAPAGGEAWPVAPRVWPNHVRLLVGGSPASKLMSLNVGSTHNVTATDSCCKPYKQAHTVVGKTDPEIWSITLTLKMASLALRGTDAPKAATLVCRKPALMVPLGGSQSTKIDSPSVSTLCTFAPGGKSVPVQLVAGSTTYVQWPK